MKCGNFEHYEKTKIKLKTLVLAFEEVVMLIRITKAELSSFKTLGGDNFEHLHEIF